MLAGVWDSGLCSGASVVTVVLILVLTRLIVADRRARRLYEEGDRKYQQFCIQVVPGRLMEYTIPRGHYLLWFQENDLGWVMAGMPDPEPKIVSSWPEVLRETLDTSLDEGSVVVMDSNRHVVAIITDGRFRMPDVGTAYDLVRATGTTDHAGDEGQ